MDNLDNQLIAALRRDGRASLSVLAADLNVTRATVRARMDRLIASGGIATHPVRGLMMLECAGRGADRAMPRLRAMPEVTAVHSTNGTWDLIAEIGTDTLERFDAVLSAIRQIDGITRSETSLLLSSRR